MFEKVLIALDFSPYSQKILDHISEIPGIQEVILLHVVNDTQPARVELTDGHLHIEDPKILLKEKKEYLLHLGLKVRISADVIVSAITQGAVSHAILGVAETENVSLIVIGARGINPIQELLLGSVSSSVIRYAKTNVLLLHFSPGPDTPGTSPGSSRQKLFSKVLAPTDFSKPAGDVLALVKTIPGINEVILLHVVNRAESQSQIDVSVNEAQSRLLNIKKECMGAGVDVKLHVRVGDPTEMILSVAEEEDASLIAMSAYGTDWVRDFLLGSTTFTVVRRSKRPVLIIRTGQET
ncbi:MAG: universal stress protein [Methanoregula sp.]|nr:universal stress protein [Methanoregula sp.]